VGAAATTGKARAMSSASACLDEVRSRSCPRESDGRLRVSTLERESESEGGGGIFASERVAVVFCQAEPAPTAEGPLGLRLGEHVGFGTHAELRAYVQGVRHSIQIAVVAARGWLASAGHLWRTCSVWPRDGCLRISPRREFHKRAIGFLKFVLEAWVLYEMKHPCTMHLFGPTLSEHMGRSCPKRDSRHPQHRRRSFHPDPHLLFCCGQ
jgi:hypothetical protein